jgi:hypothetical protein
MSAFPSDGTPLIDPAGPSWTTRWVPAGPGPDRTVDDYLHLVYLDRHVELPLLATGPLHGPVRLACSQFAATVNAPTRFQAARAARCAACCAAVSVPLGHGTIPPAPHRSRAVAPPIAQAS